MRLADLTDIEGRLLAFIVSASKTKPPIEYDLYKVRASFMYGVQVHEVTPEQRQAAKNEHYRRAYAGW